MDWPIIAAISAHMDGSDQATIISPKMQDQ